MPKIKICGITNLKDYNLVNSLGSDFSGFIFYKKSPRFIEMEKAAKIIHAGKSNSFKVGVFVDEAIERVREIYAYSDLDMVQLHGSESPDYCRKLDLPYWKVIKIKSIDSLAEMNQYREGDILLDTFSLSKMGGTGIPFSKKILDEAITYKRNLIIAGGICEQNISKIFTKGFYAIDLCSSIEKIPGIKDEEKLISFFNKINSLKERTYEVK